MILALDTSSENCSVALSLPNGEIDLICEHSPRSHTQLILPMVKAILERNSVSMSHVDGVAFGKGPGSFTGIRIAAGIAQGLAFGVDKPIYAISNLEAMALQAYRATGHKHILVALDARMNEVYWQLALISESTKSGEVGQVQVNAQNAESVSAPESILFDDQVMETNEVLLGVGSGFNFFDRFDKRVQQRVKEYHAQELPDAKAICELAQIQLNHGESGLLKDALPSYVRDTVTWKKLPGRE